MWRAEQFSPVCSRSVDVIVYLREYECVLTNARNTLSLVPRALRQLVRFREIALALRPSNRKPAVMSVLKRLATYQYLVKRYSDDDGE